MTMNDLTADERKRVQEAMGWALIFPGGVMCAVGGLIHMMVSVKESLPLVLVAMLLDVVGLILSYTRYRRTERRMLAVIEAERARPAPQGAPG